jgi:hypothetical protein
MSTSPTTQIVEVGMDEVKELIDRARRSPLSAEECQLLMDLAVSYVSLTQMLKDRGTTIDRLRKLVFGSPSEKTRDVLGTDPGQGTAAPADAPKAGPRPGHGRNGADA